MLRQHPLLASFALSIAWVLISAAILHAARAMNRLPRTRTGFLSRAPAVDLVIAWLTMGPPIAAAICTALADLPAIVIWLSIPFAIAGQITALYLWCWLHEAANPAARRGPRLVQVINRNLSPSSPGLTGRVRNHVALLWMLWAVPCFNVVRLIQYIVYPVLVMTARLPRYDEAKWVNLSRHKIDGLVGHDLIWCLYCDWMTGVWSLGSEMLRNIESFWCPIRFASPEKCANCTRDFPDLTQWIDADQPATAAAELVAAKYPAADGSNAWLGHPVRMTMNGQPLRSNV